MAVPVMPPTGLTTRDRLDDPVEVVRLAARRPRGRGPRLLRRSGREVDEPPPYAASPTASPALLEHSRPMVGDPQTYAAHA